MATKKKYNSINSDRFDELLAIAGYTYPRNDKELELFEILYKDYDFKLKNARINPNEIINQAFTRKGQIIKMIDKEEQNDIDTLKIAARKGNEEIPQEILDKMKSKHKNGDKQS